MPVVAGFTDALYRAQQSAWSAWVRRRRRADFDGVRRFCLFVGYPRSGHSVVGAFLNAHRNAVIAHELNAAPLVVDGCSRDELYARILTRARWFHLRGDRSNHDYRVPNQWQGRYERLDVIGDKRGGAVTRCLAEHPDLFDRLRRLVGVPLRLVHVVRNPFDNIAAISIWHHLSMEDAAAYYFMHCATTTRLDALCAPDEIVTVRHEAMIADPRAVLSGLCGFLGLALHPGYLDDCARIVFPSPTGTRSKVGWPGGLVAEVERKARAYPFLEGYAFDAPGAPPA
jgi:hypothetical protein